MATAERNEADPQITPSFKIKRSVWRAYKALVSIPFQFKKLVRNYGLRLHGARIGRNLMLGSNKIHVVKGASLYVADNVRIGDGVLIEVGRGGFLSIEEGVNIRNNCIIRCRGRMNIGAGTFLNSGAYIECFGEIKIGNKVLIAPNVHLYDFEHGTEVCDIPMGDQPYVIGSVFIGPYSWLCAKSTVTMNVTVGEGVIIGAHSLVTKDIPDYTVAVGIPAKILRTRSRDISQNPVFKESE